MFDIRNVIQPTAIKPIGVIIMFFSISGKFAPDARKAFFSELSMRLEMMAEVLTMESKNEDFDEIIDIVNALKTEANAHRVDKILEKRAAQNIVEVKF